MSEFNLKKSQEWFSVIVFFNLMILVITLVMFSGCSSGPTKEDIKFQVYQCKRLCASGSVDATAIEGLNCACKTRQPATITAPQPIIINRHYTTEPKQTPMRKTKDVEEYTMDEPVFEEEHEEPKDPRIKKNATVLKLSNGRTIYSQTKY